MKAVYTLWLVNVNQLFSHRNDEYYWRLEFIDDASGELVKTYISENNINYRHWKHIIELWQPTIALALSGVRKPIKPGIISADCKPHLIHEADRDQLMGLVMKNFFPGSES